MSVAQNIDAVRERIEAAARRCGRHSREIALMGVTKTQPANSIIEAYQAGLRLFGENRVLEFSGKTAAVHELPGAEWRLIGHLQSNKVVKAARLFQGVDSLESLRTAEKLNDAAASAGKRLPVLIEVNLGGEASKTGVSVPSADFEELMRAARRLAALEFQGLMTVPPYTADAEGARPFFRALRQIRDEVASRDLPSVGLETLSMGMSHDFEVAIEEGSTCVRVGTAIFGERPRL